MDVGVTLVLGATIAALVAVIKGAFPELPPRRLPLVVVAISIIVVGVGAFSGEVAGTPFELLQAVVAQVVSAMGLREGLVAMVPRASGGVGGAGTSPR